MIRKKRISMIYKAMFVTFIMILTSFSIFTTAENQKDDGNIIINYLFNSPIIKEKKIGDITYDQVVIQDLSNSGNSGEPSLPSKGAYILLPQGKDVNDITITTTEKVCLGVGFSVEPVGEIMPISDIKKEPLSSPDTDIYNSNEEFPGSIFTEIGIYGYRGYEILVLELNPVQYIPITGELFFYENIEISVDLKEKITINPLFRSLEKDRIEIENRVDNPEIVSTYVQPVNKPLTEYDLLIITTDTLKDRFEPLKATHDANGISTIIKTTSDIGSSNPDNIRDYITTAYNDWNIDYVLIGADDDIIPAKDLFVRTVWYWPWSETEENMPSDIYYACLDGTYNYNGNDYWGEPDDGPDGGDVDLVAEVYVGRAPVGTTTEVDNFVGKTIAYMYSNDDYLDEVLMAGELLNDNPWTWGGNYMDELIDGSSANGYTTTGVPSNEYDIDTLYDQDWAGNNWPKTEIKNRIDDNLHLINHLGHANYQYVMKMSISDVNSLTNDKPCFVYSQGCMAGGFDNGDCIAEYFTVKTDNAAFAVIMNARYGWYNPGGTDSSSQHYHREFWDAVFGEGKTTLGSANHDSKEDNLYRINDECMRWCYYQLNLFGDPVIDFLNHLSNTPPETPNVPSGTETGRPDTEYTYSSSTTDPEGHQIYYKWDFGNGESEWLGPYDSGIVVDIDHEWNGAGLFEVKVKAKDIADAESGWSDSIVVTIYNNAPEKPARPSGETSGNFGTEYTYSSSTSDMDDDQIYYKWDWGDDSSSEWLGPYSSGDIIDASHTWSEQGNYEIKVISKDVYDEESDWSDPLAVSMPKIKASSLFFIFLERFFPNIFSFFNTFLIKMQGF